MRVAKEINEELNSPDFEANQATRFFSGSGPRWNPTAKVRRTPIAFGLSKV